MQSETIVTSYRFGRRRMIDISGVSQHTSGRSGRSEGSYSIIASAIRVNKKLLTWSPPLPQLWTGPSRKNSFPGGQRLRRLETDPLARRLVLEYELVLKTRSISDLPAVPSTGALHRRPHSPLRLLPADPLHLLTRIPRIPYRRPCSRSPLNHTNIPSHLYKNSPSPSI